MFTTLPCLQAGLALYFSVSTGTNIDAFSTAFAMDCNVLPATRQQQYKVEDNYMIVTKLITSLMLELWKNINKWHSPRNHDC